MRAFKRVTMVLLVLAVMAALLAAGYYLRDSRLREEAKQAPTMETVIPEEATTETMAAEAATEPVLTVDELVGPWHLAEETAAIYDAFPGSMEFGSTMEIRSDGRIAWYIGAEGGVGTYTIDGNMLHCELTNALDESAMTMDFTAEKRDGQLFLNTTYHDIALCWRWGEGENGRGD